MGASHSLFRSPTMPFVDINVIPVPTAAKAAWLAHGRKTTPVGRT